MRVDLAEAALDQRASITMSTRANIRMMAALLEEIAELRSDVKAFTSVP